MNLQYEHPTPETVELSDQCLRPEIHRIIAKGTKVSALREGSTRSAALLVAASLLLVWLSFTPVDWPWLAWIALVPLSQLLRLRVLPARCYFVTWCMGFIWALCTLQWMRLGHPAMFLALVALAFYVALYVPAFVWAGRRCLAAGLPLWLAVPVVWTSLEYVRSWMITGFAWYFLGHTQYNGSTLIQICDVTGVYGVTFLICLVSGAIAVNIPARWLLRLRLCVNANSPAGVRSQLQAWPLIVTTLSIGACLVYGYYRRTPAEQFPAGPVFALIQGNFTPDMKHDEMEHITRYRIHDALTREAVLLQPDFIVWPETMFPFPERSVAEGVTDKEILAQLPRPLLQEYGNDTAPLIEEWRRAEIQQRLAMHAQAAGAAMVIGIEARVLEKDGGKTYNAAAFVRPDLGYSGRYDKLHRVVFGEYIPLKGIFPWLHHLTPFGSAYGIEAGHDVSMFEYGNYRIAPLICFEDTVPSLVRKMASQRDAAGKGCDVLVNLTNDAWFHGSSELDQHLIIAAFRCVETRTPMVRSVNGGISAFIDGNGRIREPAEIHVAAEPMAGTRLQLSRVEGMRDPETGHWRRQFTGIISGQVPLDPRESLYVQLGDWFARLCLLVALTFTGLSFVRKHPAPVADAQEKTK
ncbi:MAG: apolipoprotein N-acyltransferase [Planctomycetaceae bacterium]